MRALLLIATALAIASVVNAAGDEPVGEVLVLDDDNFAKIVPEHDILLVEFYAPWCGHCKQLAPKYDEAAKMLAADPETKHIRIAKMDADAHKKVPGQYGVSGFPHLKLFRNGEVGGDYNGERTAEAIVEYMKRKATSAVNKEITDAAELKKITKSATVPTLVALCSSKDHVDYRLYKTVVARLADSGIEVYHSVTPAVLEAFGFYSSGCSIQLFSPSLTGKPTKATYKGTVFKDKLRDWVLTSALTPFTPYNSETQKLFEQLSSKHLIKILRSKDAPTVDLKALEPVAKKHENDYLFATANMEDYKGEADSNCDSGVKICTLLRDGKKKTAYALNNEVTASSLEQFIIDFEAKKLKPRMKSEPTPVPNKAGEVSVVVGSTFETEVIQNEKDVMIEFYAPWCGHCKALAPKYEALAKEVAGDFDNLIIAKMDMDANDLLAAYRNTYKVQGFPTIYFAKKGRKTSPIKYEGERDTETMKKWIEDQRK
jgi:protein disulfide isomerase